MNSIQYEEFCRYFLSEVMNINISDIQSINVPNPKRVELPEYKHQIDLYWEVEMDLVKYLNIANAKWRSNSKVDQPDVLLLQQVKTKVAAHKAVMLTNYGYTEGAKSVAQDEGIALHIVKPNFDYSHFDRKKRSTIQGNIKNVALNSKGFIWELHTYTKSINFPSSEIPEYIQEALSFASNGDLFYIRVLLRSLDYLNHVKNLIELGEYGSSEMLPEIINKINQNKILVDEKINEI